MNITMYFFVWVLWNDKCNTAIHTAHYQRVRRVLAQFAGRTATYWHVPRTGKNETAVVTAPLFDCVARLTWWIPAEWRFMQKTSPYLALIKVKGNGSITYVTQFYNHIPANLKSETCPRQFGVTGRQDNKTTRCCDDKSNFMLLIPRTV
jgi:hypothetical protein